MRPDGQSGPADGVDGRTCATWQQATDVVSQVAGWGSAFRGRIAEGPEPERIRVAHFTEDYLPMHGVTPILGRDFTREDTEYGAPLVALLGYGYWQSRFGGSADVIGETIRLEDDVATIVGVLPPWFNAATPLSTPLQIDPKSSPAAAPAACRSTRGCAPASRSSRRARGCPSRTAPGAAAATAPRARRAPTSLRGSMRPSRSTGRRSTCWRARSA